MSTTRDLANHLAYFDQLGVNGISRDPRWRERESPGAATSDASAADAPMPDPMSDNPMPDAPIGRGAQRLDRGAQGLESGAQGLQPLGTPARHDEFEHAAAEVLAVSVPHDRSLEPAADLAALRAEIGDCTRCVLHTLGRKQVVFGAGNPSAELMFVGEAPGADEDQQGEPFVGKAGQLLTKIIEAIALSRSDVYIANVIKCRPPGNRNPEPVEVATCSPFLLRQIDTVRPKVIVALGTFAAQMLLESNTPISRLRGQVHTFRGGIKLVPTFHPAYLLRSPDKKRDVWEDMKIVREILSGRA